MLNVGAQYIVPFLPCYRNFSWSSPNAGVYPDRVGANSASLRYLPAFVLTED